MVAQQLEVEDERAGRRDERVAAEDGLARPLGEEVGLSEGEVRQVDEAEHRPEEGLRGVVDTEGDEYN